MTCQICVEEARDAKTGVAYVRIGYESADVVHPYFHREAWSADDAGFIFSADREVWYLDIASRQAIPLSGRAGGRISAPHVARDGRRLLFIRDRQVCVMPLLKDGPVEVLFEIDADLKPCEISPNCDDTGMAVLVEVKEILRRVSYVELATKKRTDCFEGHRRIGHLQMNPAHRDTIMFADQHDAQNWQRMYTVKTDGREHFPFYRQRPGEWVTHECFSRDGKWVTFTVAQPTKGLHAVRADGSDARRVAADRYWHACPSADASTIAADLYDGEVRLVRRETGEHRTVTPPWTPGGRMVPQGPLHPHPCLSRTGRWLLHVDGSSGRGVLRLIDVS